MKRIGGVIVLALLLGAASLVAVTPLRAQSSITLGQTVYGCITDANPSDDFTFAGTAGDVISIAQIALNPAEFFDPYVYLYSPTNQLLSFNDDVDFPEDLDSLISGFALPVTGTYTIRAGRFGSTDGSYGLTVVSGTPASITIQLPSSAPCSRPFDAGNLNITPAPQPRQGAILGLRGASRSSSAGSNIPAGTQVIGTLTTLNGAEVNVRLGPGLSYGRIGTIGRGQAFPLLGQSGGWYIIDYFGVLGYVSAEWTSVTRR